MSYLIFQNMVKKYGVTDAARAARREGIDISVVIEWLGMIAKGTILTSRRRTGRAIMEADYAANVAQFQNMVDDYKAFAKSRIGS